MKIAVASTDGQKVDQHFGHAQHFFVYEICDGMAMMEGARKVKQYCSPDPTHTFADARLAPILEMLSDCRTLYVAKIGDAPKLALEKAGIATTQCTSFVQEILQTITGG
jgi:nitrogen fixation protein NifB